MKVQRIIVVKPQRKAEIVSIPDGRRVLDYLLRDYEEVVFPTKDCMCLTYTPACRIPSKPRIKVRFNRKVIDAAGCVVLCGFSYGDYAGLTDEQIVKYLAQLSVIEGE